MRSASAGCCYDWPLTALVKSALSISFMEQRTGVLAQNNFCTEYLTRLLLFSGSYSFRTFILSGLFFAKLLLSRIYQKPIAAISVLLLTQI
ncbi:hypothetical protein BL250_11115 [Erwinia sp. OLTSP20]|nr:hypothetical protein BV501_09625 [Erwinia sp. OAMSP11]PIJ72149.1 hypothetical protein BK416_10520 [Erwinia sp. OLSSP12]PIJ81440.1 hypothetical protein BLD47_09345 [Erwinia sp. OLCASP19]PIJ84146.1 hypothetical protein BLD46_08925 [Erwinia sp. OLMTSP26]PIJ85845.1 hypothetical protein BLD49_10145 [Erwinia sp. OLMDSP33]PIJ92033.1 hypothetical protein BL249_07285 [Erwinia sp. OLFS4]PIJ92194.1 hypothetical protein BL250_11115 [Erwinia sp. OLTSP20]